MVRFECRLVVLKLILNCLSVYFNYAMGVFLRVQVQFKLAKSVFDKPSADFVITLVPTVKVLPHFEVDNLEVKVLYQVPVQTKLLV